MVGAHLSEENVAEHAANSLRLAVGARRARREGARGCAPSAQRDRPQRAGGPARLQGRIGPDSAHGRLTVCAGAGPCGTRTTRNRQPPMPVGSRRRRLLRSTLVSRVRRRARAARKAGCRPAVRAV